MAKTNETLEEMIKAVHSDVKEIKTQTQKTNGRVSNLEMWKAKITGALIITDILLIPIVIALVIKNVT